MNKTFSLLALSDDRKFALSDDRRSLFFTCLIFYPLPCVVLIFDEEEKGKGKNIYTVIPQCIYIPGGGGMAKGHVQGPTQRVPQVQSVTGTDELQPEGRSF